MNGRRTGRPRRGRRRSSYRGPQWWPLVTLRHVGRSPGLARVLRWYLLLAAIAVASGIPNVIFGWNGVPVTVFGLAVDVTIYPPLLLTLLLAVWLGPTWGAIPAYLATLVLALYSGIGLGTSALFALASPIEVLVFWGSMVILNVSPELRRWRDVGILAVIALLAPLASSVAVPVWNAAHDLDFASGQRIWRGWVIGAYLQIVLLLFPALWLFSRRVRRLVRHWMPEAPHQLLPARAGLGFAAVIVVTLVALVVMGIRDLAARITEVLLPFQGTPELAIQPLLAELGLYVGLAAAMLIVTLVVFTAALARLHEQERRRARRDNLTGCLNRRAFYELFHREARRCQRLGHGLALIQFDIDRFKQLNDTHGHDAGDEVLRGVARRIGMALRDTDYLFRWGGEEFLVLLPQTPAEAAPAAAERLRAAIADRPFHLGGASGPVGVTISLGVAWSGRPLTVLDLLLGRVDEACYAAKREGRNRAVLAHAAEITGG